MHFQVRYKEATGPTYDVEAEEHALEGDWLVFRSYLKGRGQATVFRAKGADVFTVEVVDAKLEVQKMTDDAAMGRIWALFSVKEGRSLEDTANSYPGPAKDLGKDAIKAVFSELGISRDGAPDKDAQEKAKGRLGGFTLS
jgi:hypothetical protein